MSGEAGKKEINPELINRLMAIHLSSLPGAAWKTQSMSQSGEKALVSYLRGMITEGRREELLAPLPCFSMDSMVFEMQLRVGRADIVLFHMDGSASVVEVKDGNAGLMSVLGGVGQVGLYATQISMTESIKSVNRALLWSALPTDEQNQLVHDVCRQAGVVPLFVPTLKQMLTQDVLSACAGFTELLKAAKEALHGTQD